MATSSVAYPEDLMTKVKKAAAIKGMKFLHVLSPCPPGWKTPSEISIEVARLATETKVFPIYEVIDGEEYSINVHPKDKPVLDYLKVQGRYRHLTPEEVAAIQKRTDYEWEILLHKSMMERFQ